MSILTRRTLLKNAAALGATAAWGVGEPSRRPWQERRDLFPEGVASGDPDEHSVLLWTRYPRAAGHRAVRLHVEVAEDEKFARVVARAEAPVSADSDWTCRVLAGGLKPARVYWYRFADPEGLGSRIGRTITAPGADDPRPVRFAFVSCQNANAGAQHAYRRMIFEDERAPEAERLGFVLHLGDFIYEIVWYPEDREMYYDRKIREIVRYPHGEKITNFHVPTTVEDYRAVYKKYLADPDLQDARARWPFVAMWDNHEFSWMGFQSIQRFEGKTRPAQTRKVAANQAFFEYQPARLVRPNRHSLDTFDPPQVIDAPIARFDEHGLGQETNNLTAIHSLRGYRSLRWGKNVELIVTDQRSYRSEDPNDHPEAKRLVSADFPQFVPQEAVEVLDAGRAYPGGAPDSLRFGSIEISNFRKDQPAYTILGAEQKAWFLDRLRKSQATWKIWGNTTATLEVRGDPGNLPAGLTRPWPGAGFGVSPGGDHSTAFVERGEIYDFVKANRISGFATVAGDRHSFWAGLAAKALPPKAFEPVGVAFVTGSISAPGLLEALEHNLAADHPLRQVYLPTYNMLLRHGVRSCLEYAQSGDLEKARALSNPDLSPHVSFVDMGGHGYSVVRCTSDAMETEFVCIPRPIERNDLPDGGPLRYRVSNRAKLWRGGETPRLETRVVEGDAKFSI